MTEQMSRPLAWLLAMLMLLAASAGCAKRGGPSLREGETLRTVTDAVRLEFGDDYVQMPTPLDETALQELYGIDPADVQEFCGDYSMTMTSADNFVAVRAREGRAEAVLQCLENRRALLEQAFEEYLPGPLETARAGRAVARGDYVFLVMLGDPEQGAQAQAERAVRVIDAFFEP